MKNIAFYIYKFFNSSVCKIVDQSDMFITCLMKAMLMSLISVIFTKFEGLK